MGQMLGGFWGRAQGKRHVRKICDDVFSLLTEENRSDVLAFGELHRATLLVYNAINRNFPGPHKEPPSAEKVRDAIELLRSQNLQGLNQETFYKLILKWTSKELNIFALNRLVLAFLAAGAMTEITRKSSEKVPRIRKVVEKIPTTVLVSAYALTFVLLEDYNISFY